MSTDYDEPGAHYLLIKSLPWKRFAERHTFFKALGPLGGVRLIDVACGDGYYSRALRDAGAEVVGVDVSREMIQLARQQDARDPRGIRYEVADATSRAWPRWGRRTGPGSSSTPTTPSRARPVATARARAQSAGRWLPRDPDGRPHAGHGWGTAATPVIRGFPGPAVLGFRRATSAKATVTVVTVAGRGSPRRAPRDTRGRRAPRRRRSPQTRRCGTSVGRARCPHAPGSRQSIQPQAR
jgi:Methyltransferase domain